MPENALVIRANHDMQQGNEEGNGNDDIGAFWVLHAVLIVFAFSFVFISALFLLYTF